MPSKSWRFLIHKSYNSGGNASICQASTNTTKAGVTGTNARKISNSSTSGTDYEGISFSYGSGTINRPDSRGCQYFIRFY